MSLEQKRVAIPVAFSDKIPNPKRIQTDDDKASVVNLDSGSTSTLCQAVKDEPSVNSSCTLDIPQESMIEELIDGSGIEDLAVEVLKDRKIVRLLREFLETLTDHSPHTLQTRALKHIYQAKNIWGNHRFIGVLVKDSTPGMKRYNLVAIRKLSDFLMRKIRNDPSFDEVLKYKDPASMMRNALSIWIGYWSNENMLILLYFSMGRRALGANYDDDNNEDAMNEEQTHLASKACPCVEDISICSSLIADESIKKLADELVNFPEAISMAEELLMSLQDDVPCGRLDRYEYHVRHRDAVLGFWFDPLIIKHLTKALKKSTHLVNVLKKYSKGAQILRCVERVTRIQRDPLLGSILEVEDDLAHKMRGALSILFGYWSEIDLTKLICTIFGAGRTNKFVKVFNVDEDKIEVLSYLTDGRGDVEGLKIVLADKYCEDSVEYMDRFYKIKAYQEKEESKSKCDYDEAIITVLLKNGYVIYFYMRRFG